MGKVFLVGLTGLVVTLSSASEEKGGEVEKTPPPALKEYMGRTIAQTMHWKGAGWLIRAEREREESASQMLKELGLKPGMNVCDLGCGNGFHTLEMARLVGETGEVVGVDIQPEMLEMLKKRALGEGLENIRAVRGDFHDPNLEPGNLDLILLVDVYHEFSHPVQMLAAMRRALKPDGMIVLVEFRSEDKWVPIKPLHKMSKAQVMKELVPNGFKLVRSFDGLPWQHMLFFGRAEGGGEKGEGSD